MKKVLIVEDEILARLGLRQLVDWKKLDLELLPDATDGEEALEMIRNSRPDIILLDLNIPRVSGLEILEFLKKEEMKTRVIVVSCQEEFDVVKKAMKLGAYDYLRKLNLMNWKVFWKSVWEKQKKEIRCISGEYGKSVMKRSSGITGIFLQVHLTISH